MLRIWNMGTHQRTRENDTLDATQNAPTHHTNERYKKIVKQKDKTNEEKDTNDFISTGDESEDGQNSNTHKDQDSDVSSENDTEEEIDTAETEEENWIDKKEARTMPHKRWDMRRFDAGTRLTKNEMEIGAENSNITE